MNVPAPHFAAEDPRTFSLADHALAWRRALDTTVVSAVLTVEIVGDHLRSGGSVVNVIPEHVVVAQAREGSIDAAIKAALSAWTAGQASYFGTRGITVNAIATGKSAEPSYDGLSSTPLRWPPRSPGWPCSCRRRQPATSPARLCMSAGEHWRTSADRP